LNIRKRWVQLFKLRPREKNRIGCAPERIEIDKFDTVLTKPDDVENEICRTEPIFDVLIEERDDVGDNCRTVLPDVSVKLALQTSNK
jgi:hypothetical protein